MDSRDMGVVTSAQFDPRKAGVGSSPFVGDLNSTGIRVPEYPTLFQNRRYLFRLASIKVPARHICCIKSIHQLLYIGCDIETENNQDDEKWFLEIPVTDPLWAFPDGNVSWHIRGVGFNIPDRTFIPPDILSTPDTSGRRDTTDSAILAIIPATGPGLYAPLNGGNPYGITAIPGLDTWRDIRYPWEQNNRSNIDIDIKGPVNVVMYASVYQTDPNRRPNKPVAIETAGLRKEDLFMLNYPTAKYTRIGGRIVYQLKEMER